MSVARKVPRLPSSGSAPDIEELRKVHDKVFLGRLDGILQKYDRDFQGVADEIDLSTGEIVVNNGHVSGARDSYDIGRPTHRPAPYIPVEAQDMAKRSPMDFTPAKEVHNVVHHHYAPELHQNMQEQRSSQPDLTSSMLRILERIERIEARNEVFHNHIATQLGLLSPPNASQWQGTRQLSDQQHEATASNSIPHKTAHNAGEASSISAPSLKRRHASAGLFSAVDADHDTPPAACRKRKKRVKKSHDVWAINYASSSETEVPSQNRKNLLDEGKNEKPQKGSSTADRPFWTDEENQFLVDLVRSELRLAHPGKGKGGRWQRISTAFSSRFPGRGLVPVRNHLSRLIPGGMKTLRADPEFDKAESFVFSGDNQLEQMHNVAAGQRHQEAKIQAAEDQKVREHNLEGDHDDGDDPHDENSSEGLEILQTAQARSRKSREVIGNAKKGLARRLRKQDKHDKKMRIPPPRLYSQTLPYRPETPKNVRRSSRSRPQTSMREFLDQYEAIFLESDNEEAEHLSDWSSVSSEDEAIVDDSVLQAALKPWGAGISGQIERATKPVHSQPLGSPKSEVEKEDKCQSSKLQPAVEECAGRAQSLATLTPGSPTTHTATSQGNKMLPKVNQTNKKIQPPKLLVRSLAASEVPNNQFSRSSGVSAATNEAAKFGPKDAGAYPSPDSANGKFVETEKESCHLSKLKPVTIPNSQESELMPSSLTSDAPKTLPRLLHPTSQKVEGAGEPLKDGSGSITQEGNDGIGSNQIKSIVSNSLNAMLSASAKTGTVKRGRGRPRKSEVVVSLNGKSAKKPRSESVGATPVVRRNPELPTNYDSEKPSAKKSHVPHYTPSSKAQLTVSSAQRISTPLQKPFRQLARNFASGSPPRGRKVQPAIMDDLSDDELA